MVAKLEPNIEPLGLPAKAKPIGMPETIRILVEESDDIPRNGLFLGHNGTTYLLRPGEEVEVPIGIIDILDHAVLSVPQIDPLTRRVVGTRQRLRFPYRRLPSIEQSAAA